jgi:TonB family protein
VAAVRLSVERPLKAFLSVLLFAATLPASAEDLWCADNLRAAFREQAASTFNPAEFVLPKEPAVKGVPQGAVDLLVALDADGGVTAACVLESDPKDVFEQVTVDAVHKWRYAPADVATLPVGDRHMKVHVGLAMQ